MSLNKYTDLLPGAQYDLRVLARTEQGWPNISETLLGWTSIIMPTVDPDDYNIRNVMDIQLQNVNTSHLKMTWNIKENSNNDQLKFDSWQIYCENLNGDKLFSATLEKNSTEYLFTNLEPNVSYNLGLCILTKDIPSDCLSKTVKSILHDSDNIPVSLEATPLSSSSIQITWTVINRTGMDKFEICYQPVQTSNTNSTKCFFINETKAIIGKLKAFTLYQFKVRQFQIDSNYQFSESIECYTSEDVPGKPEDVQGSQNGTRIRIAWKEPSKTNGMILTYFISYYTSEFTETTLAWGNVTVPGNKTSATLPDLPVNGRYYVMVQAATKAGYGRPSNPILVFIGGAGSKIPSSSDKQEPPINPKPDQSLGKSWYNYNDSTSKRHRIYFCFVFCIPYNIC